MTVHWGPVLHVVTVSSLLASMSHSRRHPTPVTRAQTISRSSRGPRRSWELLSIQSLSHIRLFATLLAVECQAPLSSTLSQNLLKFRSIESVMLYNHLILCRPLLLPSVSPSIRVFSNPAVRTKWPKYWSFRFSISPSNEYSGLISFRMDWFALPAVQRPHKSLLQHHSSKPSILRTTTLN